MNWKVKDQSRSHHAALSHIKSNNVLHGKKGGEIAPLKNAYKYFVIDVYVD